jgi:hypothetical protein
MAHEVGPSAIKDLLSMRFDTRRGMGRNFVRFLRNSVLLEGGAD